MVNKQEYAPIIGVAREMKTLFMSDEEKTRPSFWFATIL